MTETPNPASQQPDAGAAETGQPAGGLPGPGRWRKKPVEITAIQFTGGNVEEIWAAFGAAGIYGPAERNPDHLILTTVHGDPAPCRPGDWVIPDAKPDTFYPCKPDVFAVTYEPAGTPPATDPLAFSRAYRLITDTSGIRHLVDGGGVRYFTEIAPDAWEIAVDAATWAAWRRIAESLLATPEPQR